MAHILFQQNLKAQHIITSLLLLTFEDISFESMLQQALGKVLSMDDLQTQGRGCLFLADSQSNELVMVAAFGLNNEIMKQCERVAFGRCICGRAAISRTIKFVPCINEEHEIGYDGIIPHGHYCVPIMKEERLLGLLNVYVNDGHEETEEEGIFLRAVEHVLANIIDRKNAVEAKVKLENELNNARRLESIGTLAAGIAHEINTPVQFIGDNVRFFGESLKGMLELMDLVKKIQEKHERKEPVDRIMQELIMKSEDVGLEFLQAEIPKAITQTEEGLARVTSIVRAMKDFSHIGENEKSEVDLAKAINSTVTISRNEWKYVADLETVLDPTTPLVSCYLGDINQVILNLIVNAAHAIADVVGTKGAEKGKISVRLTHDDKWVNIYVKDTGAGIPDAVREKVFDPFFTTKGVGKGTGQGLSMAYSTIVEKHNGKISFNSEFGKGTTFLIKLPFK